MIFGCSAYELTTAERDFFRKTNPWAFILFARNIESPNQVKKLCMQLRDCTGREAMIFIDQEGGRVQRLKPPHWRKAPPARYFGDIYKQDRQKALRAIWLNFRLIAHELKSLGINANCVPVLDLPVKGADPIISDRAFSTLPSPMTAMAHSAIAGLTAGGVAPVIKHIPGHGRADVDSHLALPVIKASPEALLKSVYIPFQLLSDVPMAMTAHVIVENCDPNRPVTLSPKAMTELVRGKLAYDGLVMTDDMDMKALSGDLMFLSAEARSAGCDIILHCDGNLHKMEKVSAGAGQLSGKSLQRAQQAELLGKIEEPFDPQQGLAELEHLFSENLSEAA